METNETPESATVSVSVSVENMHYSLIQLARYMYQMGWLPELHYDTKCRRNTS